MGEKQLNQCLRAHFARKDLDSCCSSSQPCHLLPSAVFYTPLPALHRCKSRAWALCSGVQNCLLQRRYSSELSVAHCSPEGSTLPKLRASVPLTYCAVRLPPGAQSCPKPTQSRWCSGGRCTAQALAGWKQTWCSFTNKVCFFPLELWLCFFFLICPVKS